MNQKAILKAFWNYHSIVKTWAEASAQESLKLLISHLLQKMPAKRIVDHHQPATVGLFAQYHDR